MEDIVKGYLALFRGNQNAYGQWNPQRGSMITKPGNYVEENKVDEHLEGKMGLGLVPVLPDANCLFGVIDIDNHDGKVIDLEKLSLDVASMAMPLVVCRSKSGGAHCYLFCKDPIPAYMVRKILTKWAGDLGYEKAEIFPKQSKLEEDQIGNWINLPYFGALSNLEEENPIQTTDRYAMEGGKPIRIEAFIESAKLRRITKDSIESFLVVDHPEAPPCVQGIMKGAVSTGYRNQAIYAMTIYMRQAFPADYREKIYAMNQVVFDRPLGFIEVKRTVASASKKDYMYKCGEEPCKSLCEVGICKTREYGIGQDGDLRSFFNELPEFTNLKVFKTDPPVWEISVNGKPILLNTAALYNSYLLSQAALEKAFIVIPPIKNSDWLNILAKLMNSVKTEDAPEEASTSGLIISKLRDFVIRSGYENMHVDEFSDPLDLHRGMPIVREFKGQRAIVFRGVDFVDYLKRIRFEELKGTALWLALKACGVRHGRARINSMLMNVWYMAIDQNKKLPIDPDYLGVRCDDAEEMSEPKYKSKVEEGKHPDLRF